MEQSLDSRSSERIYRVQQHAAVTPRARVDNSRHRKRSALFPSFPVSITITLSLSPSIRLLLLASTCLSSHLVISKYYHIHLRNEKYSTGCSETVSRLAVCLFGLDSTRGKHKEGNKDRCITSGTIALYELLRKTGGLSLMSEILTMTGMFRRRPLPKLVHDTWMDEEKDRLMFNNGQLGHSNE